MQKLDEKSLSEIKLSLNKKRDFQNKESLIFEQDNRRELIFNENFRNNQNYVLWKNEKINNVFYFLTYSKASLIEKFIMKILFLIPLFFKKMNFSIKQVVIFSILFYIIISYLLIVYLKTEPSNTFFILLALICTFIEFFILYNKYYSYKYIVNNDSDYTFLHFSYINYWITNNSIVYSKNYVSSFLSFDLFLKNRIKKDKI